MLRSLRRRWEKRREKILRSRRLRTLRCLGWSVRMKLPANFPRRRLRTWLPTVSARRDCVRLRSFWCIAAREAAFAKFLLEMTAGKNRTRLDVLMVERGLAPSREKAQAMILAGEVLVNGAA